MPFRIRLSLLLGSVLLFTGATAPQCQVVSGSVLDEAGAPAEGASVTLVGLLDSLTRLEEVLDGGQIFERLESTSADASGRYRLEAEEPDFYGVLVEAKGQRSILFLLQPLIHSTRLAPARLAPSRPFKVKVLAADGTPLAGARVSLSAREKRTHRSLRRGDGWKELSDRQLTGEDGTVTLSAVDDKELTLTVGSEDHLLWQENVELTATKEVHLESGTPRELRLVGPEGRPVAGAVVSRGWEPLARSDDEGRILLPTPDEPMRISLSTPRLRLSQVLTPLEGNIPGTTDKAPPAPLTLELEDIRTLSGQVLDTSSRRGVAGALVWTDAWSGTFGRSDKDGFFAVPDNGGRRTAQAAATGYVQARGSAEGEDDLTLLLKPAAVLRGDVVDGEGRPLADAEIRLLRSGNRMRGPAPSQPAFTDLEGGYSFPEVPIETPFEVQISARGFATHRQALDPLEAGESRTLPSVVLVPALSAYGQVVDEDDRPVAGAEVDLGEQPSSQDFRQIFKRLRERSESPKAVTDAEGRYRLDDLDPGTYRLRAAAAGFAPARVPGLELKEGAGEVDLGVVVLVPGVAIEGIVLDPDGKALADVTVTGELAARDLTSMMEQRMTPPKKVNTGVDGRFRIDDLLPASAFSIRLEKEGWVADVQQLAAPTEEPARLTMQPAGRLSGRISDADGQPLDGARVRVHLASGLQSRILGMATTSDDGRYLIETLLPGSFQVTGEAEGYRSFSRSGVEIVSGENPPLDLVLSRGIDLPVLVRDPQGRPVPEVMVRIHAGTVSFMPGSSKHAFTDADGLAVLTGLETGPVQVQAHDERWGNTSRRVEVGTHVGQLELQFEGGVRVTGQVIDGALGTGVAGATVQVSPGQAAPGFNFGSRHLQDETDSEGRFEIDAVTAGSYFVRASKDGFAQARSESFEVVETDVTGMVIELRSGGTIRGLVLGVEFDQLSGLSLMAISPKNQILTGSPDYEGRFSFENLAPGDWTLRAAAADGRQATKRVKLESADEVLEVELELGSGLTITGTVTRGGEPLAAVRIWARGRAQGVFAEAHADGSGRFKLSGLEAGTYEFTVVSQAGQARHRESFEITGGEDILLQVSGSRVAGRVRDEDGQPLEDVMIEAKPISSQEEIPFFSMTKAMSDSLGAFDLGEISGDEVRLVAQKAGYSLTEQTLSLDGTPRSDIDFVLTRTSGITLRPVRTAGGRPSTVLVRILDGEGNDFALSSETVDSDGVVSLTTLPAGPWRLLIAEPGGPTLELDVTSPGDAGTVALPRGGLLRLEVPELFSEDSGLELEISGPGGAPYRFAGQMPSNLLIRSSEYRQTLPAGTWSLDLKAADGRSWQRQAVITEGGETVIRVP